jgi:short-subunit dehydrogenase
MCKNVNDKTFLLTGSTGGIGRELARTILMYGGKVILNGRSESSHSQMLEEFTEYTGRFIYIAGDISRPEDCERLVNGSIAAFGRLDGLILNAGISSAGLIADLRNEVPEKVVSTNLTSAFYLLRLGLPHLLRTGGSVLFVSSLAGFHGLPGYAPYSASKMALLSLFQSLRIEMNGTGIFTAIAMVGFTENDAHKQRMSADGVFEPVPSPGNVKKATQEKTAMLLFKQLSERKRSLVIHSTLGLVGWWVSRLFPGLFRRIVHSKFKKEPVLKELTHEAACIR